MGWGGKGKGKGWGGGGGWASPIQSWGKGFGFKGKDKGKGKGKRPYCPPEKQVWIGGLPADQASTDLNKRLQEHMKQAGNCKFVSIGKSGSGAAQYTTEEEAQQAIATLNGSDFEGSVI